MMVEAPARAATVVALPAPALVLANTSTAPGLVEEAEELALGVFQFFSHSAEAVGSTVHHLQVVHALERLEGMPLEQVVDLRLLKSAIHPTTSALAAAGADGGDEGGAAAAAAERAAMLDSALDSVSDWRLRDVVDVNKLADALQDVPTSDWVLDSRQLQRDAGTIRRAVHWEKVSEAVRPQQLRRALAVLGGGAGGSPFAELDMRTAVSAVRLEVVQHVLHPVEPPSRGRGLESSGMWTWES
ncbi:hypothetical protein HYH02_003736 [Chlamydomonas schloesseri]|uniref:Uncharacterized protein n=1 Tax=Chlamydomonas schloesseri TaxID=2026947 RepID=A0A835WQ13_9CHLO|nr:hypothetical protein HYH02_003736 [Chlamydomonas schloesseri]|eukprot:KAG2451963.1 hypothetical protein HYH02_003736 [Chlamydomonas schloesseri]